MVVHMSILILSICSLFYVTFHSSDNLVTGYFTKGSFYIQTLQRASEISEFHTLLLDIFYTEVEQKYSFH